MTDYLDKIASIGNLDARMAEVVRRAEEGGAEANRLLLAALGDGWAPLRMRAASLLAERLDPESERVLVDFALHGRAESLPVTWTPSHEEMVRRIIPLALRTPTIGEPGQEALVALVGHRDEVVRYHALLAAHVALEDEDLRDVVSLALSDDDPAVVVVAAQIAAQHGWSDLVPRLLERRDQLDWDDRMHLTLALSEFPGALEPAQLEDVVDDLVAGLEKSDTIAAAAQALGRLAPPRAVEPLRRAMNRRFRHPLLRVEAAAALARMEDDAGIEYLGKLLTARRRDTRGYAIQLAGRFGLDRYRDQLEEIAQAPKDWHADTAALALAHWVDRAARELLERVAEEHPSADVREAAIEALEKQRLLSFNGGVA